MTEHATFAHIGESTREDWAIITGEFRPYAAKLAERVIEHLKVLDGDCGGFPVDRLTHCLQTATLAHRDGRDEEYVVCALLHDIGDTLGSYNHPDIAAAMLKPFVSPENHWMVLHHGIFQGYHFFHNLGLDPNLRDQYRDQPELFERTAEFCARYDAPAFRKDYDTLPLSFFEPMLRRVFSQPRHSMYVKKDAQATA
ncbi:HD phosphohydrolase [Cupriavidus phytorum]|uniref:HD phosphohydrolase n=2 Tax=Cupriavidus TaxID=106589 RepID=A0A375CNA9_9BURK|nr:MULTISPECIES: HD domain-containing protein [Cupriavidus]MCO4862626.1 HD domain-containing protein [Cupriavidus sp. WGlv3]PZX26140.1 putative HD phosphohydrolase [Cupriavidus alkaliphilus]SOY76100.1 HD phosphohydrolase [Cupriavidus taiwanensis]